jgi:hypothetical protein
VLTGGSLAWLKLSAAAFDQPHGKRIDYVLNEFWTGEVASIQTMLGVITINASVWDRQELKDLVRAKKDAERGPRLWQGQAQAMTLSAGSWLGLSVFCPQGGGSLPHHVLAQGQPLVCGHGGSCGGHHDPVLILRLWQQLFGS